MGREISVLESDADKGQQVGVLAAESEGPPATLSRPRDPGLSPPSHPHALFQFSQPLFQVDWAHGGSENRKHVDISGNKGQEIVFRGPRGSRDWELGRDGGGVSCFLCSPSSLPFLILQMARHGAHPPMYSVRDNWTLLGPQFQVLQGTLVVQLGNMRPASSLLTAHS